MLPLTSRTLFLFLLFDSHFFSCAWQYKDCKNISLKLNFTIRGIGDVCYGISKRPVSSVGGAQYLCWGIGSVLAEPETRSTAELLISFSRDVGVSTFIGIYRQHVRLPWIFRSTHISPKYQDYPFAPGQPDLNGQCILLSKEYNYLWDDYACYLQGHAICKIQREVTECIPNPCQNGGNCEDVSGPDKYKCTCVPGTTGRICSSDVDECASNPCNADATCDETVAINMFICACENRRAGKLCQLELPEKPSHDCPPYIFEGDTLSCTCSAKKAAVPPAKVGFLLGEHEYTPTLIKTAITTDDDGMTFTCVSLWEPEGVSSITSEKKYTIALAYGPKDEDTSISGPRSIFTDGESGVTVTLTCSSYRSLPEPIASWEEVQCSDGNFAAECRFTVPEKVKEMTIFCTLKNPLKDTVIGRANHTLKIDSSRKSVINIRVMSIGDDLEEAAAGQNVQLVCEAYGGDPRPVYLEVFHIPGIKDLNEATGGTKLTPLTTTTPQRAMRKTYSVKASDICSSFDGYRCETKAEEEGAVVVKFAGLKTSCTTKEPEAPAEVPVAPIAAGGTGSLLGLLAIAFLLWKRQNQAEGAPKLASDKDLELDSAKEEDNVFEDSPSGEAPTENPTGPAETSEGEENEASEEAS